jgi:hypothetical protein
MMKRLEMSMMGELKFLVGFESSNSRYACSCVKPSTLVKVLSIEIFFQLVSQRHIQEV